MLPGFNPAGAPVFQRLAEGDPLREGQYVTVWKAYMLSLIGNWVLQMNEGAFSSKMKDLDELLVKTGLRSPDDTASAIFSQIVNLFKRLMHPTSTEVAVTITPDGLPILTQHIEFGDPSDDTETLVRHDEALSLLNEVLQEIGFRAWVVGNYASLVERFRDGRAERNEESLSSTLGVTAEELRAAIKPLLELGFLEQTGTTYKVPMLYRGGLSITQGKAFDPDDESGEDEELE